MALNFCAAPSFTRRTNFLKSVESMHDSDEVTAWHEAGHAVVATILGGEVDTVSIESEDDFTAGDTRVLWRVGDAHEQATNDIQAALAGPVTEMVFLGEYDFLRIKAEHQVDWEVVAESIRRMRLSPQRGADLLNKLSAELYRVIRTDHVWSAIADVAERLQIDGTIDGETVRDQVGFWMRRQ